MKTFMIIFVTIMPTELVVLNSFGLCQVSSTVNVLLPFSCRLFSGA